MEEKQIIFRKDYKKPDFLVPEMGLYFDIQADYVEVKAELTVRYDGEGKACETPWILNGEDMSIEAVEIDGRALNSEEYTFEGNLLTLTGLADESLVRTTVRIDPYNNTKLMGIYRSGDILCSQCEAEGFRRITPFPDHPDILTRYRVTIEGEAPVLLSNGNLVSEETRGKRRVVTWEDPFPKPSYLFALVAGDLGHIEDSFTTMSGRDITLRIYTDRGNESRAYHAMDSLKAAMKWDEDNYGLEYDLDLFMIVAVDAFNFGAMENKGLNIFNSAAVLADREITTDAGLDRIAGIVAHEYFHNWTGNRVTCRDWFQLTLKEGLTVFRDESFTEDTTSKGVSRVHQAISLKQVQFPEDSGPNSHPIRPESYREIDNFYTPTVYRKGASVIRMIHTLAGAEGYRKGIDEYFRRHDGQAVTCEDFLLAMEEGAGLDLSQFRRWYSQSGTPLLKARTEWDGEGNYTLTLSQETAPTADGSPKEPFYFPVHGALRRRDGSLLREETFIVKEKERQFLFSGLKEEPVLSLLRDFSAPVNLDYPQSREDRIFLLGQETDGYSRFSTSRELSLELLQVGEGPEVLVPPFEALLNDKTQDKELTALLLTLPSVDDVADLVRPLDFVAARAKRSDFKSRLGKALEDSMLPLYESLLGGEYAYDRTGVGRRALKAILLDYLVEADRAHLSRAEKLYFESDNMTDRSAALRVLCRFPGEEKERVLAAYYDKWKDQFLPLTQWFAYQTMGEGIYENVLRLETHPAFRKDNPNMVRALYGGLLQNRAEFHAPDGRGYRFLAERISELDKINPGMAAHLAGGYYRCRQLEGGQKSEMVKALESILSASPSPGVREIVENTLRSS
ncbi:MAG: aminopeptidase N [Spirochaetales bacterium]|nr:aminopeptidase N [Spirochaetales bacterium]